MLRLGSLVFFRPLDMKFHRPQNIPGAWRRKSDAAFSETTEVDGGLVLQHGKQQAPDSLIDLKRFYLWERALAPLAKKQQWRF